MTEAKRRIISGVSALAFLGTTYLPNLINGDLRSQIFNEGFKFLFSGNFYSIRE